MLSLQYRMWLKFKDVFPDADWDMDISDGPINETKQDHYGIWTFQSINGSNSISIPDFTFFSFPEGVLKWKGENSHSFSHMMVDYKQIFETYPFKDREAKLFFRGADVCINLEDSQKNVYMKERTRGGAIKKMANKYP